MKCLENGQWSSAFDVCRKNGKCESLTPVKDIDVSFCKNNAIGSVCRPICYAQNKLIPDIVIKVRFYFISIFLIGK